jgi:hypothetical protein
MNKQTVKTKKLTAHRLLNMHDRVVIESYYDPIVCTGVCGTDRYWVALLQEDHIGQVLLAIQITEKQNNKIIKGKFDLLAKLKNNPVNFNNIYAAVIDFTSNECKIIKQSLQSEVNRDFIRRAKIRCIYTA